MLRRFSLLFIFMCSCLQMPAAETSHKVVVSIAPYRFFVQQIAGDTVSVQIFVPVGASFHDYEPTPKQIFDACNADLWFRIGESFESRAMQAMQGHQMRVRFVDLRDGVDLIIVDPNSGCGHCSCHANNADLHIWLSPKEVKVQVAAIAKSLSDAYPENKELYRQNLEGMVAKLDALDQEIKTILQPLKKRVMMVGHPAYGYFARDYGVTQLSIEYEGKDPTPRQLTRILDEARKNKIKTVFAQSLYGSKAVNLIAKELGAEVVTLDPYSADYFVMMREIASQVALSSRGLSD